MSKQSLLDSDGRALPLPADAPSPMPDEVEHALAAYRAGDVPQVRAALTTIAGGERTAVSGHAAMALAGIELGENGYGDSARPWLEQVAAGEDPWLGPLAAFILEPSFGWIMCNVPDFPPNPLVAQLTGDRDAARDGFEQIIDARPDDGIGDIARVLLGGVLLHNGESAAALEPLRHARKAGDRLSAGYAGHLEGRILIEQGDHEQAGQVLQEAHRVSHPARSDRRKGLYPWVALQFGELLAGYPWLDLVDEQMERSGVSMGTVVREPFETGYHIDQVSRPALLGIGLHLFPGEFEPVHAGLERLKTWSDERYERGRRLVLALHLHVEDSRNEEHTQGLAQLRQKLDLPQPK